MSGCVDKKERKHLTRWLFKIAVLGGMMFSWKIVGVLVKIWKRFSWKIGAVLVNIAQQTRDVLSPRKLELFLWILYNIFLRGFLSLENSTCSYNTLSFLENLSCCYSILFLLENLRCSLKKSFTIFDHPRKLELFFLLLSLLEILYISVL